MEDRGHIDLWLDKHGEEGTGWKLSSDGNSYRLVKISSISEKGRKSIGIKKYPSTLEGAIETYAEERMKRLGAKDLEELVTRLEELRDHIEEIRNVIEEVKKGR